MTTNLSVKNKPNAKTDSKWTNLGRRPTLLHSATYKPRRYHQESIELKEVEPQPGPRFDEAAPIWNAYLKEAERFDNEMIGGFQDTIDSVLVFAALSAGVIATFVAQTSQALEPDQAQITNQLLVEQIIPLLRAGGDAAAIERIPSPSVDWETSTHSVTDVAVNALGYLSLALSVGTAVVSVLVKQWLQLYVAATSGNTQDRALTRQLRYSGLYKWRLPEVVGVLPLLLHLALGIFATSILVFVYDLHPSIAYMVILVTAGVLSIYVATVFLTAFAVNSPYRIPVLYRPIHSTLRLFEKGWFALRRVLGLGQQKIAFRPSAKTPALRPTEINDEHGEKERTEIACEAIAWLHSNSTSRKVQCLIAEAISRLGPSTPQNRMSWEAWVSRHHGSLRKLFTPALLHTVWTCVTPSFANADPVCDYPTCSAILDTLEHIHAADPSLVGYPDGLRYALQKAEETGSERYMEFLVHERGINVVELGIGGRSDSSFLARKEASQTELSEEAAGTVLLQRYGI
ncbi:hypothetical protein V5O48_001155 [Marasmius crinis-equi]|uniref:DUF6535 domain-containing protein n=1 Tax=Marasmius crinis-equi TaxID=585013 RepID=A0ABR3FZM1_9AGAR